MAENKTTVANENAELKRGIKGWQVAFIGLGGVIGSCYFLGVGECISKMGPAVIIAFLVVGVIVYGTMIAYAELLVNFPRTGSFVSYCKEFLSPAVSTSFGWAFWFNWVCYVPSEAIAVSTVITSLVGTKNVVPYIAIALGAMLAITIINLCAVDIFAKIESGLAISKVIIIMVFIIAAFGIWCGLWGSNDTYTGFLAGQVNFGGEMTFTAKLFPLGLMAVVSMMVTVLVTFQGTEIVGLTAAESENPQVAVPKACKSVTYRIALLYLVPLIIVIMVFPYNMASADTPVFADIMNFYHMGPLGTIFSAVVLLAAFSCANTSFYGTVRAMFGLSFEGLAPKFLCKVDKKTGNPRNAVLWTLAFMWCVLIIGLISQVTGALASLYTSLLSMRRRLKKNGYDPETCLKAKISKGQMWIPYFAFIAQIICLIMLVFDSVPIFMIACCAIFLPMAGYKIADKTGRLRELRKNDDEIPFDEVFPPIKTD